MESDLPWLYQAVRDLLDSDADFMAACGGRLSERAPSNVSIFYATIQFPTSIGSMGGGGYRPFVQVDGWCPPGVFDGLEASQVVWRIASRAHRALGTARNVAFQTIHWSGRSVDLMPLPPDTSRGESAPLHRAMTRAELTIHNR